MSKSFSGLFGSTAGTKQYFKSEKRLKSALGSEAKLWSAKKKDELSKISRRKADLFNTSTVAYDMETGIVYHGMNNGIEINHAVKNPAIFGNGKNKGLLPNKSLNKYELGNCAEVDAINSALNNGAKLKNIVIYTIHTTKSQFGNAKAACENCTHAFKGKIKNNLSGWEK
jgi:hypothetical protein